jgi:hypothetical protein
MKDSMTLMVCIWVLVFASPLIGDPNGVLWNAEAPPPFGATAAEGKVLQKEIPGWQQDMRMQLEWRAGEPCKDANNTLKAEISMMDRIICDILQPGVRPAELPVDKHLLVSGLPLHTGSAAAIVIQWKQGQYTLKVMKTLGVYATVYVTVRKVGTENAAVPQFVGDILTDRILPAKWEAPFYYGTLRRESRIVRGGMWMARDTKIADGSGHIVELDANLPAEWGPIGEGRYKRVDFCTDGKFVCFKILGGPKASLAGEQ